MYRSNELDTQNKTKTKKQKLLFIIVLVDEAMYRVRLVSKYI